MYEIIPVAAGLVAALFLRQIDDKRIRMVAMAVISLVIGFAAATISGEIAESPLFVLFDAAQAALASVVLIKVLERRSASDRV